ncbi:hypothetical protein IWQ61_002303 [Dispira simplex]|nr:hypothetical protein IWQ61_002303 [Dispira simplex]
MDFIPTESLMDTDGLTAPSGLEVPTSTPVGGLAESLDSSTDKPTPTELNAYLSIGRKAVEDMSSVDIKYPTTDDLLQIATSGEYHQQLFGDTELFQKSRTVPLPDALFDQYDLLNCRCCMGLFPEIHRVWITIDHRLFLWNYEDGGNFQSYDEQDQIILSTALVKPCAGVLDSRIQYLLALSTPLEVTLLGVSHEAVPGQAGGAITFYTTQLVLPTDNVSMLRITGTANGRVIMAGSDGHLYEFVYAATEGWFTRRCRKVNLTSPALSYFVPSFLFDYGDDPVASMVVDDSRHIMYTLSKNSAITVYFLGLRGDEFRHVEHHTTICQKALTLCPSSSLLPRNSFVIVSIHAIEASRSRRFHLVAVTSTGCRLYFTTLGRGHRYDMGGAITNVSKMVLEPVGLELLHVRVPPRTNATTNDRSSTLVNLSLQNFHAAYYHDGLFLAAGGVQDDADTLMTTAPDAGHTLKIAMGPSRSALYEYPALVQVDGKTWVITEATPPGPFDEYMLNTENSLYNQVLTPPRRFLVLTNMGINFLTYQRPVDLLYQLLASSNTTEQDLLSFIDHFDPTQVCTMCLQIVCTENWAFVGVTKDFSSLERSPEAQVKHKALAVFFDIAGPANALTRFRMPQGQTVVNKANTAELSHRYRALVLYLWRLLSPVWSRQLITVKKHEIDGVQYSIKLPLTLLSQVERQLHQLRTIAQENPQFIPQSPKAIASPFSQHDFNANSDERTWREERQALYSVYLVLTYASEAIAFLQILHEFKITPVVKEIPERLQTELLKMELRDLVISSNSRDICRELMIGIIQLQSGGGVNVVIDALRKRCSHFCSSEDVTMYKAMEQLKRTQDSADRSEQMRALQESLQLFRRISSYLSVPTLSDICATYRNFKFHTGAVELALTCARAVDPSDLALSYYNGVAAALENPQAAELLTLRKDCYQCVFQTIESLDRTENRSKFPGPVRRGGLPSSHVPEQDEYRQTVLQRVMSAQDSLFYYCLYEWYLTRGDIHALLNLNPPHLEEFLTREPMDLEKCDLLWSFYARNNAYLNAAKVLSNLAESENFGLQLPARMEYLSLAVGNARSSMNGPLRREGFALLQDLEEKLEVAQIQLEVQRILQSRSREDNYTALLERVNGNLLTISDLFNDYAVPLRMYGIQLLIIKSSNHHDVELVESIWDEIFRELQEDLIRAPEEENEATEGSRFMESVAAKVRELGQLLYPSDLAFPLCFLCPALETLAFENRSVTSQGWSVQLLHQVGVPYNVLFEVIYNLTQLRGSKWKTADAFIFLINDIVYLLTQWLDSLAQPEHNGVNNLDTFPVNLVDRAITGFIMTLTASNVPTLLSELQEIQRRIHVIF